MIFKRLTVANINSIDHEMFYDLVFDARKMYFYEEWFKDYLMWKVE